MAEAEQPQRPQQSGNNNNTANNNPAYTILPPGFPTPRRQSQSISPPTHAAMGPPQMQRTGSAQAAASPMNGQQQQHPSHSPSPSPYPAQPQSQHPPYYTHPQPPYQPSPGASTSTSGTTVPSYPPVPNFPWAPSPSAGGTNGASTPQWPATSGAPTPTPAPQPKPKKPKKKPAVAADGSTPVPKPTKKQLQQQQQQQQASGVDVPSASTPTHVRQPSFTPAPSVATNGTLPPTPAATSDQPRDAQQVMDVLGGSGIDLQAEEEAMRARQAPQPLALAQQAYVNSVLHQSALPTLQLYPLSTRVHAIANQHDVTIDVDTLNVLSSAARIRFRNLIEAMVAASRHRCWSTHQRPPPMHERVSEDPLDGTKSTRPTKQAMYHEELISDPSAWITAIEKADRGDEARARRRRAQRQREALLAANGGASSSAPSGLDADGDESMGGMSSVPGISAEEMWDKKRKKPVSARNMSEDVRRRLANNTAARALGGPATPKWMTMGASSAAAFTPKAPAASTEEDTATNAAPPSSSGGGLSSLPKPRFAPAATSSSASAATDAASQWAAARATANLAPTGSSGTKVAPAPPPSSSTTTVNPHGWGDPALRALAKEQEARKRAKRVHLCDALHAIEMERRTGSGRGSGEVSAFKRRVLGEGLKKG